MCQGLMGEKLAKKKIFKILLRRMSLTMIPGNKNHFCASLPLFTVLVTFDARME